MSSKQDRQNLRRMSPQPWRQELRGKVSKPKKWAQIAKNVLLETRVRIARKTARGERLAKIAVMRIYAGIETRPQVDARTNMLKVKERMSKGSVRMITPVVKMNIGIKGFRSVRKLKIPKEGHQTHAKRRISRNLLGATMVLIVVDNGLFVFEFASDIHKTSEDNK